MDLRHRFAATLIAMGAALPTAGVAIATEDGATPKNTLTASWALDRIDQRALPLDSSFAPDADGSGVAVYVLDTGVRTTHVEFTGRVETGFDATGQKDTSDCQNHGTGVASTAVGTYLGVAKKATLVPVRAACNAASGSTGPAPQVTAYEGRPESTALSEAIDWVVEDVKRPEHRNRPAVLNMSMLDSTELNADGTLKATPMVKAVERALAANITVVTSAGNKNVDACSDHSLTQLPSVIVVGATNREDERKPDTAYGPCVTLFAPGTGVLVMMNSGDADFNFRSGTSFSSPLVAGAAALYLQQHPKATPAQVKQALVDNSTENVITNAGTGSPNRLLHVD